MTGEGRPIRFEVPPAARGSWLVGTVVASGRGVGIEPGSGFGLARRGRRSMWSGVTSDFPNRSPRAVRQAGLRLSRAGIEACRHAVKSGHEHTRVGRASGLSHLPDERVESLPGSGPSDRFAERFQRRSEKPMVNRERERTRIAASGPDEAPATRPTVSEMGKVLTSSRTSHAECGSGTSHILSGPIERWAVHRAAVRTARPPRTSPGVRSAARRARPAMPPRRRPGLRFRPRRDDKSACWVPERSAPLIPASRESMPAMPRSPARGRPSAAGRCRCGRRSAARGPGRASGARSHAGHRS